MLLKLCAISEKDVWADAVELFKIAQILFRCFEFIDIANVKIHLIHVTPCCSYVGQLIVARFTILASQCLRAVSLCLNWLYLNCARATLLPSILATLTQVAGNPCSFNLFKTTSN